MPHSIATHLGLGSDHFPLIHSSLVRITPYFDEGFRVVLVGAVFDLTRRICEITWEWVVATFTVTATFESEDETYKWITEWLEEQPTYSTSREFEVIAKRRTLIGSNLSDLESQSERRSTSKDLASYFPARDTSHWLVHRFRPLRVLRSRSMVDQYRSLEVVKLTYGNWKRLTSKPHRNYASVVLDPKMKEHLFSDVKDFLEGKEWYAQRGIPYRRGYLLFGTPGAGKTSSIHALASELGLDIYIVPLSLKAIDDGVLSDLITSMPQRCILLYEDIDAAFSSRTEQGNTDTTLRSGVTLSGLLNTIDGVQAQEGCLLFATSNHPEHLDPALIRPGRMDIKIEYTHATQWQAEQLFRLFYPFGVTEEKGPSDADARKFAEAIPKSCLSVAQLQGYLMRYKGRPHDAAQDIKDWVELELAGSR